MKSPQQIKRRGFSLIELLVVTAIMGVLVAIALPALSSLMQSSDLTYGGQIVADQFNLARQTASARNTVVEVRLIQLPGRRGYSGVQLWRSDTNGTMKPLRGLVTLPQNVTISERLSPPGAIAKLPTGTMPSGTSTASAPYAVIQVRPSGEVTPILDMDQLFFTVVPSVLAEKAQLPDNYFLLQINPLTAAPIVYRP